jgi:hypothetical protein
MIRKPKDEIMVGTNQEVWVRGIGRSKIISRSNTRNSTARIKNRVEKGIRADCFGSKPHS